LSRGGARALRATVHEVGGHTVVGIRANAQLVVAAELTVSHARTALLLASVLATGRPSALHHIGLVPSDQVLLCASGVFGKPIYRNADQPWPTENIACPSSHDELVREFAKDGFRVFETPTGVHVAPEWIFRRHPNELYAHWVAMEITLTVANWNGIPGSRTLGDTERSTVAAVIEKQARTPPLATPYLSGKDGRTISMEVLLLLDAHAVSERRESIVAVWSQKFGDSRLIYGELEDGNYRVLWDSPIFKAPGLRLGYDDVDGDGTTEILLAGAFARDQQLVAVFDRRGRELTRQEDCGIDSDGYDKTSGVCPIIGAAVDLDDAQSGRKDIVVERWYSSQGKDRYRPIRFALVNGHYVPIHTE
jgi:hypothetical protein